MKEAEAEKIFKHKINDVKNMMGKKGVTYLDELNSAGFKFFKVKFKGCFASDKIPNLNDLAPYAIINVDKTDMPGSHWVAIAKTPNDNLMVFDSFGRKTNELIPDMKKSGNGKIIDTDYDANQNIKQYDCGMRCIAWLYMFDKYGSEVAKLI